MEPIIHNNIIHTNIFQSDRILKRCCETFATHYTCRKTDLNLTIARATTNGFVLQIININSGALDLASSWVIIQNVNHHFYETQLLYQDELLAINLHMSTIARK